MNQHLEALEARYAYSGELGSADKTGTLAANASTSWEKNTSTSLSFDWADPRNPGTGSCSVRIGDSAQSLPPPREGIDLESKAGKLTNNTTRTIRYTLK
ncbi:hypothetical protein KRR26_24815 [Corallococcus sp. M34]|uniref:hypothetical protein n=1 Tax=Citreicoccus inhibens TaxID=2849499 RepID=UPI001C240801|nr:hypothetical protein [Citreicoccus inhibens]MBU8898837.1 hypothetical protein [Citreicoccus inhibens]